MAEDAELLSRYIRHRDNEAFAELVRRHLDLVYAVALRQVGGDTHLAEDVCQLTFTALARKARALAGRTVLAGWLYRTTQFLAIDAVRADARRRSREKEAHAMNEPSLAAPAAFDAEKIRPLLDQAIGDLNETDRDAVVLRFLKGCSFSEVGEKLCLTENAARMRVERALDKLHGTLRRRGVTSTGAALASVLGSQVAGAAPAGLAAAVSGVALTGAAGTSAAAGLLAFMSIGKLTLATNVALAGLFALRPALIPPPVREFFGPYFISPSSAAPRPSQTASLSASGAGVAGPLWLALRSDDLPTLIARLRAADFPPEVIGEIVRTEVYARYQPRLAALSESDPNTPFWKAAPLPNAVRNEKYRLLEQERSRLIRSVHAEDLFPDGSLAIGQRRLYGDLSTSKAQRVQRIEDDYNDMVGALRIAMKGITLPADREKLAVLTREKSADIAAVLTPEELAEYRIRNSPIVDEIKSRLQGFEPSEAEFRSVLLAQHALNDRLNAAGGFSSASAAQRQAAQQQVEDEIKAALGEARYVEYVRGTSSEFIALRQLADRSHLPPAAAAQAFEIRERVVQESNRIFDSVLGGEQKREALRTLAQTSSEELLAALGPVAGPQYAVMANSRWLGNVERGGAVVFGTSTVAFSPRTGMAVSMSADSPRFRMLPGSSSAPSSTIIIR